MPSWMATIDTFAPRRCFVLGVALSAVNPKNLALTAAAASTIAQAGLSSSQSAAAVAVFVVIASVTVVGPVLYALVAAERSAAALASMKAFMSAHDHVIMMVVLLVLGAKLLGQGLGSL